ncbi:hypothetical protein HYC85_016689 [Camellia sinensis]|uniref:Sister chromatid cohesion protein DCC1 n=1 Tax=Camellia sinensis TaxID=4442 RepID=A0A7J7H2K2_CAMSI|nr:hypothetical protein HYC85_016689 [Camellia sinensis]
MEINKHDRPKTTKSAAGSTATVKLIEELEGTMEMETEQPDSVCGGAEAVLSLQPTSSVSIAYHSLFGPHDDLILLELDEKLLPDVLDHRVTIRGQLDEDAVLRTQSRTYAVKFVETSNSILLILPSDQSALCGNKQDCDEKDRDKKVVAPVIKVAPDVMELIEVAPRLDRLRMLLSENPYRFDEVLMENNNRSLYRWDDLIEKVQASDDELITGLQALSAVEIDGHWRIVDENYSKHAFANSVLNDWSLNGLNESEVVGVLQSDGFSHKIAQHCLRAFGSKVEEGVWRLDEKRVCVHFARGILRGGKMRVDNFMGEWMEEDSGGNAGKF